MRYLIGGSLASSVHGEPRSTNDVDLLADFHAEHVEPFIDAIRADYYVGEAGDSPGGQVRYHFNVIHITRR